MATQVNCPRCEGLNEIVPIAVEKLANAGNPDVNLKDT